MYKPDYYRTALIISFLQTLSLHCTGSSAIARCHIKKIKKYYPHEKKEKKLKTLKFKA